MAAQFGEMLMARRREMGLSIQQVANTIKIRPQIIEYFETENFAAMPPRGYAQGMISSYARYLGLNPRSVVEAYFDRLAAFERGADPGATAHFHELATDASPRSANASGRYLMRDPVPSASRFASRPMQQAGYVSESHSPHEPMSADQLRRQEAVGQGRRRLAPAAQDRMPGDPRQMAPVRGGYRQDARSRGGNGYADGYRPGTAPLPARSRQYGSQGAPRRSGQGMPPARRSGGPGGRPPRGGRGGAAPQRGRSPRYQGNSFTLPDLDPKLMMAIAAAILLLVVLIVISAVRGCSSAAQPNTGTDTPKVQKADNADDTTDDTAQDDDIDADADPDQSDANGGTPAVNGSDTGDGTDADTNATPQETPEETVVEVSINGEDTVAWIEVKLDGKSVLANEEVGPFKKTFTVTQQIEITTNKPSDVTVTKNGKKVRYDTKVSGVAKVTITVPQPVEPEGDQDGAAADGAADASAEPQDQQ